MTDESKGSCFVARPISLAEGSSDRYRDGSAHWQHVHDHLLAPAIRQAGYEAVSPVSTGASLIHGDIIQNLSDSELVLADFSQLNPNVMFEAGIRVSVNKPLVIVAEKGTSLPFDTAGINTFFYDQELNPWTLAREMDELTEHINSTDKADNALFRKFGLQIASQRLDPSASSEDARLEIMSSQMLRMEDTLQTLLTEATFSSMDSRPPRLDTRSPERTLDGRFIGLRRDESIQMVEPLIADIAFEHQARIDSVRVVNGMLRVNVQLADPGRWRPAFNGIGKVLTQTWPGDWLITGADYEGSPIPEARLRGSGGPARRRSSSSQPGAQGSERLRD